MPTDRKNFDKFTATKVRWIGEEINHFLKTMVNVLVKADKDPKRTTMYAKDLVSARVKFGHSKERPSHVWILCWGSGEGMGLKIDTYNGYVEIFDGCGTKSPLRSSLTPIQSEEMKLSETILPVLQMIDEELERCLKEIEKAAKGEIKGLKSWVEDYYASGAELIGCIGSGPGMGFRVDYNIGYAEPYDDC